MPGHMDKGTKNYRNMMKRMEGEMGEEKIPARMNMGMDSLMRPDDIEETTSDLAQDPNLKDLMLPPMTMSKMMEMIKKQDSGTMLNENELLSSLSEQDKNALEAMLSVGVSMEEALRVILDPGSVARADEMPESAVGSALGALPMSRPATRPDDMGADRTQSMDMQKEGMGT